MSVKSGSDLFIVDNTDSEWKVLSYLSEWAEISSRFDIATGHFELGALLALDGKWQEPDGYAAIPLLRTLVRSGQVEVKGRGASACYRRSTA